MHSALRGSDLLLFGLLSVLNRHNIKLPFGISLSHPAYPAGVAVIAFFGFYAQLSRAFGLPFPFNILLIPLRIAEFALSWTLAYGPK